MINAYIVTIQHLRYFRLYSQHLRDFPLYTEAIKFFNHNESMVRIAVRTLTLNVYKVSQASSSRHYYLLCTRNTYMHNRNYSVSGWTIITIYLSSCSDWELRVSKIITNESEDLIIFDTCSCLQKLVLYILDGYKYYDILNVCC
mgnify:CR=1 FL=1